MALERDPKTGKFVLTTAKAIQRERSRRRHYVKQNLRPRRLGIVGRIIALFQRGPNPFRASPIADSIAKQTQLLKSCRLLRASGEPVDEGHYVILQVGGGLQDHLSDAEADADRYLDRLDTDLQQEEAFLDECRPEDVRSGLEATFKNALDSIDADFGALAGKAAETRIHLADFRAAHGLPQYYHWGDHFTTGNIALIAGIVLFEFLLNSIFFAAANPLGLLGGAALALILSIATIVLGVSVGIAYQYNHRAAEGRGWVGKLLFVLVVPAAIFYPLLLTLARMAGEAGDLQMFHTAADAIGQHPLAGLFDLPSLGYFFFSIGVIAYTAFKYISIMGRFPGLRRRVIHAERAEAAFEQEVTGAAGFLRGAANDHIEALNSLPFFIQATVLPIKNIVQDYENVVDQLTTDSQSIGNASQLLFSYIRSQAKNATIDPRMFADGPCRTLADKFRAKLEDLRVLAARLIDREEIKPAAVERCRKAMNDSLQGSLDVLARRCADIKEVRFREKRVESSEHRADVNGALA